MQINIKLKFDKSSKRAGGDTPQRTFFIDNSQLQTKDVSIDCKEMRSFREKRQSSHADEREVLHTNRDGSSQGHNQHARKSVTNKKSAAKQTINHKTVSALHSERKSSQLKKPLPNKSKVSVKKKLPFNGPLFVEEENLRGSLPGLSGKKVLQRFAPLLSEHQKIQLINEKAVYYVGLGSGQGEDDLEGSYIWRKHEQIGYRYELLERLGSGAFGEVIRSLDHKTKQMVAVKIIKSRTEHMQLALNEINILMSIKKKDIGDRYDILRIKDFIVFHKHICIITEVLDMSLYELLEANHFAPLERHDIRAFAIQILRSLSFLRELGIVHSDLKPENVLLKNQGKVGVKIIDFGTSMFIHETHFLYIQSRFYRAPEIILCAEYDFAIDMWSFGCLLAELFVGTPLFAGDNEQEQLNLIFRVLGLPSNQYLKTCKNANKYFGKDHTLKLIKGKDGRAIIPGSRPLDSLIADKTFSSYLSRILTLNPQDRLTPLEALIDPWILQYFPEEVRKDHTNDVLIKIGQAKKEQEETHKKTSSKVPNSDFKKHKKRNSDFHANGNQTHRRRASECFA